MIKSEYKTSYYSNNTLKMMERKEEKIPFFTVWFAMEKKK